MPSESIVLDELAARGDKTAAAIIVASAERELTDRERLLLANALHCRILQADQLQIHAARLLAQREGVIDSPEPASG